MTATGRPPTSTRLVFSAGSGLSRDSLGVAPVGVALRSPSSGREGTVIFSVRLAACTAQPPRRNPSPGECRCRLIRTAGLHTSWVFCRCAHWWRRSCHRSEEHTSELQSLMRISYAVFCLKKKTQHHNHCIAQPKHSTHHHTYNNQYTL